MQIFSIVLCSYFKIFIDELFKFIDKNFKV